MEYIIKFTPEQLQILGFALQELPYKTVAALVNSINTQIAEQEKKDE